MIATSVYTSMTKPVSETRESVLYRPFPSQITSSWEIFWADCHKIIFSSLPFATAIILQLRSALSIFEVLCEILFSEYRNAGIIGLRFILDQFVGLS